MGSAHTQLVMRGCVGSGEVVVALRDWLQHGTCKCLSSQGGGYEWLRSHGFPEAIP